MVAAATRRRLRLVDSAPRTQTSPGDTGPLRRHARLEAARAHHSESLSFKPWADSLSRGSPTAAYLTLEYLRRARTLSLAQVLDMDLRVTCACQRAHDFPEGVRAL